MKKKVLLLDVDEVICFSGFLPVINEFLQTNYQIDDFEDYYLDNVLIPYDRKEEFYQFFRTKNIYQEPELLPHAIETVKKLYQKYDLYILSACINIADYDGSGRIFTDKYNFLRKYFPFIEPERFIFTSSKQLLKADIQIDDCLENLKEERELKILFPSYHNKKITEEELKKYHVIRAGYDWREGWDEVAKILLK